MATDRVIVYTDGASRGNPGRAAGGVSVCDGGGKEIFSCSKYFGEMTNNQAEYRAFLMGLEQAKRLGAKHIEVRSDSELLVRQINGEYRVKDKHIRPLYEKAQALLREFVSFEVRHVMRDQNPRADRLANLALDREA